MLLKVERLKFLIDAHHGLRHFCLPTVKEGIALVENGLSPYAGDIFHEVS